jgi:mannose-6-phosphate isomerase-like protein (cupin superfamily)
MRLVATILVVFGLWVALPASGQGADKSAATDMVYGARSTAKFMKLPVLPQCASFAVQRGDPNAGPADLLLRAATGCKIPWHWHTATETLFFVSGRARVEMREGPSHVASAGDYIHLPAKHPHQFTCVARCELFLATSAAFDIHYIDAQGTEIKPEEALAPAAGAAKKKAASSSQ